MPELRSLIVAVIALLFVAQPLQAIEAGAAPRHPWQSSSQEIVSVYMDVDTYKCMLTKSLSLSRSALIGAASSLAGSQAGADVVAALHLASLGYSTFERGAYAIFLADELDYVWPSARQDLWRGAALIYAATLYGGLDLGYASVACGGLVLRGPLTALLASLAAAELNGSIFMVPLSPTLTASENELVVAESGPGAREAENPMVEELFRQEKLPEQGDLEVGGLDDQAPGAAPDYSPAGTGLDSLSEVDLEGYLRSILGVAGGGGSTAAAPPAAPSGQGVGVSTTRFLDAVGRVTLSVDTLLRIAETLSTLNAGGQAPFTAIEAEATRPPSLAGLWIAAGFTVAAAAAVIALSRATELRFLARRLARASRPAGEVEYCYSLLLADLASKGLARKPWEAPREYADRVSRSVPPEASRALMEATLIYERVAYGGYDASLDDVSRCWSLREEVKSSLDS